jgi:hypothetical protein
MAARPILFSAPMILALLAGTKTQTRRVLKPQPVKPYLEDGDWWDEVAPHATTPIAGSCGHFDVGERLWVREAFSGLYEYERANLSPAAWSPSDPIWFWADGNPSDGDWTRPKPSIHMPRRASRLTLVVTEVRVERLQDISAADCFAEGVQRPDMSRCLGSEVTIRDNARNAYRAIWDSINGPGAWAANPWVSATSFTVHQNNIDALAEAA